MQKSETYLLNIFWSSWLYLETTNCAFVSPTWNWINVVPLFHNSLSFMCSKFEEFPVLQLVWCRLLTKTMSKKATMKLMASSSVVELWSFYVVQWSQMAQLYESYESNLSFPIWFFTQKRRREQWPSSLGANVYCIISHCLPEALPTLKEELNGIAQLSHEREPKSESPLPIYWKEKRKL